MEPWKFSIPTVPQFQQLQFTPLRDDLSCFYSFFNFQFAENRPRGREGREFGRSYPIETIENNALRYRPVSRSVGHQSPNSYSTSCQRVLHGLQTSHRGVVSLFCAVPAPLTTIKAPSLSPVPFHHDSVIHAVLGFSLKDWTL